MIISATEIIIKDNYHLTVKLWTWWTCKLMGFCKIDNLVPMRKQWSYIAWHWHMDVPFICMEMSYQSSRNHQCECCDMVMKMIAIDGHYPIHVPGWRLKWLNLVTAPGSVSNEPGLVTWLSTKYLKAVSWRNHTEKLTTLWPQNISLWPKINISSAYFTILMLNCLENTLKLQFDCYRMVP